MKHTAIFTGALAMILCFSGCSVEVEDDDADKEDKKPVTSVALDKTSISCYVGQPDTKLVASALPTDASIWSSDANEIIWTSDSPTIAIAKQTNDIRAIMVHALSPGQAIITASCGDKTAKCTVTVLMSSLELNSGDRILMQGNNFQFTATITPADSDQTIMWNMSDCAVAWVKAGNVTGVGPGETIISATAEDGARKEAKISVYPCEELKESGSYTRGNINMSKSAKNFYKFYATKGITYKVNIKDMKNSEPVIYSCWVETSVYLDEQLPDSSRLTVLRHFTSSGSYLLNSFTTSESQYVYLYVGSYDETGGTFDIQITH